MKTVFRTIVSWLLFAAAVPAFASADSTPVAPAVEASPARSGPQITGDPASVSADELARYEQLEQALESEAADKKAGAAMDKSTVIVLVVLAVVVIAVAAGSGGGGGGY